MREETVGNGTLQHWTAQEVAEAFDRDAIVVIDVRTPSEFAFEHIDGALLSPLHAFKPNKLPTGGDKPIIFHCGSGIRSRRAAEACLAAGWPRAAHMEGGFGAWKQAKLPTMAIDTSTGAPRLVNAA